MLRWVVLAVILLAVAVAGMRYYFATVANDRVIAEIRGTPDGQRASITMLLTLPDGRVLPVNYLRDGDRVFAGADGWWWRSFRGGNVPVMLEIRGARMPAKGSVVLDDPQYTRDVFKRLRPNVPTWLPDWLDAYLVVFDLEGR